MFDTFGLPDIPKRERPPKPASRAITESPELERVRSALAAIPNTGDQSLEYDQWRNIIFAIHDATGGSDDGLALAHEWSARSAKYDESFLDGRVWPYVRSEREGGMVTSATLFATAGRMGWVDPAVLDRFDVEVEHDAGVAASRSDAALFPIIPGSELLERPPTRWLIKGVLPRAELVVLFGESGAGKSFVALDLALAVARGAAWRGRRVAQGNLLYVAAEGGGGYAARLRAIKDFYGLDGIPFDFIVAAPSLLDPKHVQALYDGLRGKQYDLIVFDTLAQVSIGANENSGEDMGLVLSNARKIGAHVGATVMLVHHAGKDVTKGARGWSGIKAAADAEIEITRDEALRTIRVSKLKDGIDGAEFPFKLKQVDLGRDEDGEPISSCVIEHLEEDQAPRRQRMPKGRVQRKALEIIQNLASLDDGVVGVAEVIDLLEGSLPHDDKPGARNPHRANGMRTINSLAENGFIDIRDGQIVLCL